MGLVSVLVVSWPGGCVACLPRGRYAVPCCTAAGWPPPSCTASNKQPSDCYHFIGKSVVMVLRPETAEERALKERIDALREQMECGGKPEAPQDSHLEAGIEAEGKADDAGAADLPVASEGASEVTKSQEEVQKAAAELPPSTEADTDAPSSDSHANGTVLEPHGEGSGGEAEDAPAPDSVHVPEARELAELEARLAELSADLDERARCAPAARTPW